MSKPTAKDEAVAIALCTAKDFTQTVERVKSIIGLMDDAICAHVREADADDKIDAWVPEVFTANVRWLLEKLDWKISDMRGALDKAGIVMEPLI